MASADTDIIDAEVGVMAAAESHRADMLGRGQYMHHAACIFLQSQRFEDKVVPGLLARILLTRLVKVLDSRDIDEVILFALALEYVGVGCLADLTLKLAEVVTAQMRLFFLAALCLHPLFKTLVVYILNTSATLACR